MTSDAAYQEFRKTVTAMDEARDKFVADVLYYQSRRKAAQELGTKISKDFEQLGQDTPTKHFVQGIVFCLMNWEKPETLEQFLTNINDTMPRRINDEGDN